MRFTARKLEMIETRPGCWQKQRIGVFDGETQIGEYVRDYSGYQPFYAFEQDGKWYALFSGDDYTKTDVMTLPDCKVIGGEPLVEHGCGFCPVEFYVPQFKMIEVEFDYRAGEKVERYKEMCKCCYDAGDKNGTPDKPFEFERFGFRSGCVWGDDCSWKVQLLDLSKASEGIVSEVDIGYIELASRPLAECIYVGDSGHLTIEALHRIKNPLAGEPK